MKLPHLAWITCLLLVASSGACKAQRRGAENLRRAQDLLATQPAQAMQQYQLAAKAGADAIEVKKGLAAVHERLRQFDQAVQLLREATAQKPDDLDARLALARVEVLKGDFDGARVDLESTLRHEPPHVPSLFLFAALAQNPSHAKAGLEALARVNNSRYLPTVRSAEFAFARANVTALAGDTAGGEAILAGAANSASLSPPLALAMAQASLAAQRPRFAEWLLFRASQTRGAPEAVQEALAQVALAQRHVSAAQAAISRLRTQSRPDPKALLLLAELYGLKNDPAERIKVLRRALTAVPPAEDALRRKVAMALAVALEQSGDFQQAAAVLGDLLQRHPGFPPAVILLAKVSIRQKQPDRAIQLAETLVTNPPLRTDGYRILVSAYELKQAPAEAEAAARRFVASSSGSPDSIALLANLFIQNKHPELALREVEAGLARHSSNIELLTAQVKLTERVHGFAKAERVALAAAQGATRANAPQLLGELARLYERNKRPDQALTTYRDLAAREPQALVELSTLEDRMGRLDDALVSMRKLAELEPYDTRALLRLAMLEERAGHVDAARQTYERILRIDPDSVLTLNNLAMLLTGALRDPKRGLALARRAHQLEPGDLRITDTLGWALVRNQAASDRSEATLLLERSSGGLRSPEGYYHYGAALSAADDHTGAKEALERALSAREPVPWRAEALALRDEAERRLAEAERARP